MRSGCSCTGHGLLLKKDYSSAIDAYRAILVLLRTVSAETGDVAIGLINLGDAEQKSGDLSAAQRDYREALRVARAARFAEGVATSTGNLAELAIEREDWSGAEALAREALSLSEKVGRQELVASNCQNLAKALVQQEKKSEGLPFAQRSVDIYAKLRSPDLEDARALLCECQDK